MCKMVNVNAYFYIPWIAFSAHGMIDWTTKEDYGTTIKAIDAWKSTVENPIAVNNLHSKNEHFD